MLIEFAVTNYRSIRERQALKLTAWTGTENPLHVADLPEIGRVLRASAILGANASGKSNLLRAVLALQNLVVQSASGTEGTTLDVQPFRLAEDSARAPTEFEITFLLEGVRYVYYCSVTTERVIEEWLEAFPNGRAQSWFERKFAPDRGVYDWHFGTFFKTSDAQSKVLQEFTRSNSLFLSTAVQLNNEQLRPVWKWFAERLIVHTGNSELNRWLSFELLRTPDGQKRMAEYMRAADVGIERLELREENAPLPIAFGPPGAGIGGTSLSLGGGLLNINVNPMLPAIPPISNPIGAGQGLLIGAPGQPAGAPIVSAKRYRVVTYHHISGQPDQEVIFDLNDESDGTNALFALVGGWVRTLELGATLFIDEIDRSLHPFISRFLLGLFHSKANVNNAQLIFTTHDTTLLDQELLRRDQVWFTQKDAESQATRLYPLLDYSPRKDESLQRGYMNGRYGAVPYVEDEWWNWPQ